MPEVAEDSSLTPAEKQLSLVTTKADAPEIRVHSEVASVTRALLDHAHFSVERTRTDGETVVAVTGTLPLSCLTVKASPKASAQFNRLVSSGTRDGSESDARDPATHG